jgi:hypothetical protein
MTHWPWDGPGLQHYLTMLSTGLRWKTCGGGKTGLLFCKKEAKNF